MIRGRNRTAWAFVLPAAIPMLLLVGMPLAQTIFFSFTNLKEKNFSLWTWGATVAEGPGATACGKGGGVPLAVDEHGPAAPTAHIIATHAATIEPGQETSGPIVLCVRRLGAEDFSAARPPRLRRALEEAQRRALNQQGARTLQVAATAPGAEPAAPTTTLTLALARQPFDWRLNPDRDSSSWGFVSLKNYREILLPSPALSAGTAAAAAAPAPVQWPPFYRIFATTAAWTALNVAAHFVFGLALALLLNRRVPGTRYYRVLLMLPWAVPIFVSAFAWRWLYNGDYGLLNALLVAVGGERLPWLSQFNYTFAAVSATNIWLGIPFMMIMLLAGLQAIPPDLYEAAEIDGCGCWAQLWNVTLPQLRPVSTTVLLLGTIWTFNMFNIIWLVQDGGNTVEILATYAFRVFRQQGDYALASAYGVIILAILVMFSIAYSRILQADRS